MVEYGITLCLDEVEIFDPTLSGPALFRCQLECDATRGGAWNGQRSGLNSEEAQMLPARWVSPYSQRKLNKCNHVVVGIANRGLKCGRQIEGRAPVLDDLGALLLFHIKTQTAFAELK
jgi:hypothetical protein